MKNKMREYLRLRLNEGMGHREASREAGYSGGASKRAVDCYNFIVESKPRLRSKDPTEEEIMQFLLLKLKTLTLKCAALREEMVDVKLKLQAMNLAKELK